MSLLCEEEARVAAASCVEGPKKQLGSLGKQSPIAGFSSLGSARAPGSGTVFIVTRSWPMSSWGAAVLRGYETYACAVSSLPTGASPRLT